MDQGPVYFLLNDFVEVSKGFPDPVKLAQSLADLHCSSVSPTGSFGFHTNTCHGRIFQQVAWDSSWSSFFSKLLQNALEKDSETNGFWPMLDAVSSRILSDVIPRLLGALETGDRSIRPVLIHGDLWEGNILTERGTGHTFLTDAASYYAHSEMELGMWRCQRHAIHDEKYKTAYLAQVPRSEPAEEWDDRNRLYCIKMNLIHSAHHHGVQERKTYAEFNLQILRTSEPRLTTGLVLSKTCAILSISMRRMIRQNGDSMVFLSCS